MRKRQIHLEHKIKAKKKVELFSLELMKSLKTCTGLKESHGKILIEHLVYNSKNKIHTMVDIAEKKTHVPAIYLLSWLASPDVFRTVS